MINILCVCLYVLTELHYIRISLFGFRLTKIFAANQNRTFSFYGNITCIKFLLLTYPFSWRYRITFFSVKYMKQTVFD
jgi:hypothetical protein